jgi:hypothetical protein
MFYTLKSTCYIYPFRFLVSIIVIVTYSTATRSGSVVVTPSKSRVLDESAGGTNNGSDSGELGLCEALGMPELTSAMVSYLW